METHEFYSRLQVTLPWGLRDPGPTTTARPTRRPARPLWAILLRTFHELRTICQTCFIDNVVNLLVQIKPLGADDALLIVNRCGGWGMVM